MAGGKKNTERTIQSATDKIVQRIKDSGANTPGKRKKRKSKSGGVTGSGQNLGSTQPTNQSVSLQTKYNVKNIGNEGDIQVTGSEVIGMAQPVSAGSINFVVDFNPITWNGTRVAQMAKLFEKYRFDSIRITYIPSVASTFAGLLYMYYDRDVADAPISGVDIAANITRMMGNQRAVVGQIWKPVVMQWKRGSMDQPLFISPVMSGAEQRLTTQSIAYGYQSVASSTSCGLYKIDYVLSLYTPTGPLLSQSGVVTVPGWTWGANSVTFNSAATVGASVTAVLNNRTAITAVTDAIFEVLLDYSINNASAYFPNSTTSDLARYAPLFIRFVNNAWLIYDNFNTAIAGTGGNLVTGSAWLSGTANYSAWIKIATVLSQKITGDAVT